MSEQSSQMHEHEGIGSKPRKVKRAKPFLVQWRNSRRKNLFGDKWGLFGRYTTKAIASKAMDGARRKYTKWEFRIVER